MKKVVKKAEHLYNKLENVDFSLLVGSLSYATAFALVPTFAVMLTATKWMGDLGLILETFRPELLQHVGFAPSLVDQIAKVLEGFDVSRLGFFGFIGILFASTNLIHSIDSSIHHIWMEKGRRFSIRRILIFWSILFLLPLGISVFIGMFSYQLINKIVVIPDEVMILSGWLICLSLINKYAPYDKVKWRAALIASAVAGILLWGLKVLFFWANGEIFNYNRLYGSLAFLPLLLLWIRMMWQVVLGSVMLCRYLNRKSWNF